MDIESNALSVPDYDCDSLIQIPVALFGKTVHDLSLIGDTVTVTAKQGKVKFTVSGKDLTGNVLLRTTHYQ